MMKKDKFDKREEDFNKKNKLDKFKKGLDKVKWIDTNSRIEDEKNKTIDTNKILLWSNKELSNLEQDTLKLKVGKYKENLVKWDLDKLKRHIGEGKQYNKNPNLKNRNFYVQKAINSNSIELKDKIEKGDKNPVANAMYKWIKWLLNTENTV